ncbi:murein biosynthesis integral membrane protein MurJ [Mycobacterium sp.]|uniref:murein biosynthesis integral membrane protein MurJ n=1 Tax=Mycobacterium sp. TaxID=1785 RepID=UPI0012731128|nr:murein biosynthesis integral membrane protein MurJ [Mycobacterium sp.]KAA8966505.1 MAG: murein biosynthesis integral membrane protein MurJ [Mycobacterium sp.]
MRRVQRRVGPPPGQSPRSRPAPRPQPQLSDAAVVSRSWRVAFATLVSRLTGFTRIVLLAAILGAALSSAFSVANQLPNLIAALVLEATFTAIFVPVLARAEHDDADGGAAFVRRLVTLATTLLLVTTLLAVAAAPLLVRLMLGPEPRVNAALTAAFAYLLLPQVIFYGLSSVFMAILNTRNVFGPPAWAPVVNNLVAIAALGAYLAVPGQLSVDPVRMGDPKLLVLGIGTTLGVAAQTAVLLAALRRQRISLRPLWGIDERLKRFGTMAAAMVCYVLISQLGLVVGNQIASTAAASGPAIYNYTWLVLMLPFGMIGVTVLTVVMPRLSRNAADDDIDAVLGDLSLATRLTMITLIPTVAFMTVGGPAIGSALFAYGRFGEVDAGYLGAAIRLSAFTLIPYALVLLQLRVFYAREQPWTPIVIIVVITTVKIIASLLAPLVANNRELVAGYLGLANGLGFLAGAIVGYVLLRNALRPPGGHLVGAADVRTILVALAAALVAAMVAHAADRLLGLDVLTVHRGATGSLVRLAVLAVIMAPIMAAIMLRAGVPEARAALVAVRGRLVAVCRTSKPTAGTTARCDRPPGYDLVPYPEPRKSRAPGRYPLHAPVRPGPMEQIVEARKGTHTGTHTGTNTGKGPEVTDGTRDGAVSETASDPAPPRRRAVDPPPHSASRHPAEDIQLVPGASIANGRYRLLVFHGGAPHLRFWQALDTALDRQVALTFVDPDGDLSPDELQEILSRTLRLSHIDKPGIARILDVVRTGYGGLVVAEWIRGGSLQEVANTCPSPIGAARAMHTLAAAAEAAHRAGAALSADHPSRIRVSIEGDVVLAFPATMPDATPEADIRGIGAALYALLVNRWPLPETSGVRSGLAPAERDPSGQPVEPRLIDPDIPFQISAAATRSIQADGGIRSAATLLNLLQQATTVADRTDQLAPVDESPEDAPQPGLLGRSGSATENPYLRHRRNLAIGIGAAVAVLVVALLVLASVLGRIFGDLGAGLDKDRLGLNAPSTSTPSTTRAGGAALPGSIVRPLRATVFSPGGDADNPGQAGLAIDGNPATAWETDTYSDAVPFPGFKSGVGLLLQLPKPTMVSAVTVDLPSTGTKIQIRSSPTPTPAKLEDTTALTQPILMHPGHNAIPVHASSPTSNLLVWISTLGTIDGKSRTAISDVTVTAAA